MSLEPHVTLAFVKTHNDIDQRSLALARAIVARIDADPQRKGLTMAQTTCTRWLTMNPGPAVSEWHALLTQDWPTIRNILLDDGEEGRRLRQSSPFCGVLSVRERWAIYRHFGHEPQAA
jgi:hypothetical protein